MNIKDNKHVKLVEFTPEENENIAEVVNNVISVLNADKKISCNILYLAQAMCMLNRRVFECVQGKVAEYKHRYPDLSVEAYKSFLQIYLQSYDPNFTLLHNIECEMNEKLDNEGK